MDNHFQVFFGRDVQGIKGKSVISNGFNEVLFFLAIFAYGLEGIVYVSLIDTHFNNKGDVERGKRDVDCDKQVEKAVTVPNCVLKGLWGEGGSGGIRKKLKSEYAAYLESKFRRNDGNSI